MVGWTLTFLVVALLAALLAFTGLAGTAGTIAKALFVIAMLVFVLALVFSRKRS